MFRDPPQPISAETAAENASLERATVGIRKAYEGQAKCILNTERLKMMKVHEALHFQGHHIGRTNLLTGMREEYYISDLNSSYKHDFIFRTVSMSDTDTKYVSSKWLISKKINLFLDRFISLTSSKIPMVDQRDLSEQNYRLLSAGMDIPKPHIFAGTGDLLMSFPLHWMFSLCSPLSEHPTLSNIKNYRFWQTICNKALLVTPSTLNVGILLHKPVHPLQRPLLNPLFQSKVVLDPNGKPKGGHQSLQSHAGPALRLPTLLQSIMWSHPIL